MKDPNDRWLPKPGVYLNLPEKLYFSADAVGSTDLKVLAFDPASYWYTSHHNKWRQETKQKEAGKESGKALHCLILEGREAYLERYAIEPQKGRYAETRSEIRELLEDAGIDFNNSWNLTELAKIAKQHGLGGKVYQVRESAYKTAVKRGQGKLTEVQDNAYRHMAELIRTNEKTQHIMGSGLNEVTVFWYDKRDTATLLRARFDKLTLGFIADLKTFSRRPGMTPAQAAARQVEYYHYDIQRALYHRAREALRTFVAEKKVHSFKDEKVCLATPMEILKLEPIALRNEWRWLWLFYQVRNDESGSERAPVLHSWVREPHGEKWDEANNLVDIALRNYRSYSTKFGFETPWADVADPIALDDEEINSLRFKGIDA